MVGPIQAIGPTRTRRAKTLAMRHAEVVGPGSRHLAARRAWYSFGAAGTIALAVAALLALRVANQGRLVDTWWFGNSVIAIGLGGVGLMLVIRVPANVIGRLFLFGGLCQAVLGLGRQWAVFVELGERHLPGASLAGWLGTWPFVPAMAAFPLILLFFPDGALPSRRWRPAVWWTLGCTAGGVIAVAVSYGPYTDDMPGLTNPIGIRSAGLEVVGSAALAGYALAVVLAAMSLVARRRGADTVVRQQLKWVMVAGGLLAFEVLLEIVPGPGSLGFTSWTGPLAVALFIGSIVVAVLRYRLWDLDVLIRWSLVYGALTLLVAGAYLGVVIATEAITASEVALGPSLLAASLAVAVVAVLRDRVHRWVERAFYGDRRDPYRALTSLGERLDAPGSSDDVLVEVVDAIAQSLRLGYVAVIVPTEGLIAATGTPGTHVHRIPLVFRTHEVGQLAVSPRQGTRLGRSQRGVLTDLARPVAAVLQAVAAGRALEASRLDLMTAREAERRRVRRDLHDGLGPALAATRMKLDGALLLIDGNPDQARAVLTKLADEVAGTVDDVRRLVDDLQPSVLSEIGLVAAVSEQARAFTGPLESGGALTVEVHAPMHLHGLAPGVEIAAYRIVCEALANVARHAGATRCRVTMTAGDDLRLRVDDDGVGIGANARVGLGTISMEERSAELGGTCCIGASPLGGTQVAVSIPSHPAVAPTMPTATRVPTSTPSPPPTLAPRAHGRRLDEAAK